MTETVSAQILYLRNEIADHNRILMQGVFLVIVLLVGSFIAGLALNQKVLFRFCILLLISGIFFVARQEHMIKRPVPWITMAEKATAEELEKFPSWEQYHAGLKSRKTFLVFTDIFCPLAFYYLVAVCWVLVFPNQESAALRLVAAFESNFVPIVIGTLLLAVASVPFGVWASDK